MDGMIMDNLPFCSYTSWYYYVFEPDDVLTGIVDIKPNCDLIMFQMFWN